MSFKIEGPATISFSGGRSSAMMLHHIVEAHGGSLPNDVQVVFANTGKEREETLRFVHECGVRWRVNIVWLEYRSEKPGFEVVGFNSASRDGEPFEALIGKKTALPNWQARWCTGYLKVGVMAAYLASAGFVKGEYTEVIGLRDDEGARILTGEARAEKDGRHVVYPLAEAGIRKPDVAAFWKTQDFDLGLLPGEGNCDLCFLKGRGLRKQLIRANPRSADWWVRQESGGRFFDRRDRYAGLVAEVESQPDLFNSDLIQPEYDVECGDMCGGDSPEEMLALQKVYEARRK